MNKAVLLSVENGVPSFSQIDFEPKKNGGNLDFFYETLECGCIDIVKPLVLKDYEPLKDLCLIVDDEGLMKNEPVVNPLASLLYGSDIHGQPLCGKVLVCKDVYTDDGVETGALTGNEVVMLDLVIQKLVEIHNELVREAEKEE